MRLTGTGRERHSSFSRSGRSNRKRRLPLHQIATDRYGRGAVIAGGDLDRPKLADCGSGDGCPPYFQLNAPSGVRVAPKIRRKPVVAAPRGFFRRSVRTEPLITRSDLRIQPTIRQVLATRCLPSIIDRGFKGELQCSRQTRTVLVKVFLPALAFAPWRESILKQRFDRNLQPSGQRFYCNEGRIRLAALDPAHIGPGKAALSARAS
jgi:hypothetical protein